MSRMIDANALMEDINESLSEMTRIGIAVGGDWLWAKLNDAIEHAPTIEPERKRGTWRRRLTDSGFNADWRCSECGWKTALEEHGYNFCPNCGADMRERREDE